MAMKILESSPRFARFEITDITTSEANALRRTLIGDIPKLAIDKVSIHHGQIRDKDGNVFGSSLALFDEMIAQRLAMVPLVTDLKMNFRDECTCEGKGCTLCTVTYSINKLGPGTVMSSDLQPLNNPSAVPSDLDIPIVKLRKDQALLVTADAMMGRGSLHSKWQVSSGVSYKVHREFTFQKSASHRWTSLKEKYPNAVLTENKERITFTDDNGDGEITSMSGEKGVEVTEDQNRYVFKFETDGSLPAIEVLDYSLKRIPQRLNTLLDSLVTPD
ncbi:MAG: DNA-directed RNA polymerase subunit D [Candidatus Thermoplasmatota archaeon]|jgi:DNA-directed RNA polymerase subunit D|nr:DNA-directed RNA polymerase subunit D [Candidatus Thermoplasmatota archaeon]